MIVSPFKHCIFGSKIKHSVSFGQPTPTYFVNDQMLRLSSEEFYLSEESTSYETPQNNSYAPRPIYIVTRQHYITVWTDGMIPR